jgi:outer membrane protein OmpA-like peptidoglycan-associated protein
MSRPPEIRFFLIRLAIAGILTLSAPLHAAEPATDADSTQAMEWVAPVWWFGLAGAANLNFYQGTTQQLNGSLTSPAPFHKGFGAGLYVAPVLEYRPHPVWGGILQLAYDDRRGAFDDIVCPCGEIATLSARPAYLSIEPSLRVAPWGGAFYAFIGPRVGFLAPWGNPDGFHYTREGFPSVDGDFSKMRPFVFSGQVGAGYEFEWERADTRALRVRVAPFASYQPHFGQDPRDDRGLVDRWALSTVRVGAVLKFGKPSSPLAGIRFGVSAPRTVVTVRKVEETFPLRNYVFFDEGSVEIPGRYARLSRPQAAAFREEQLLEARGRGTGRSARQIAVYHQVLNIIGSRLQRLPDTRITLAGSSTESPEQGRARAEAVKAYLTGAFGIAPARIAVEGRRAPAILTTDPEDVKRVKAEHERVEILSGSADLLVQIGEGNQFMLKPVQIQDEHAGTDSVVFHARGAEILPEWWLDLTDDAGNARRHGPYTGDRAALRALPLLGDRKDGITYVAILTGRAPDGSRVERRDIFRLSRRNAGVQKTARYAVLFDLDQAQTVATYEHFLRETVTARIPDSSTVFIRGRTDEVGDEEHNLDLARERAESVRKILKSSVARAGHRAVEFEPSWTGEAPDQAPFGNATPEERSYNRTVIIDIVPE